MTRRVLITGASSGIGNAIAKICDQWGYQVIGTHLPHESGKGYPFKMIPLDVTSDDSVRNCIEQAGKIDVLVNNAGYYLFGAVEETTIEEAKAQFEVNFFGVLRMTNAVLPAMRQRRDGQIINISSLFGWIGSPFSGIYNASKHAIEGYTKTLSYEVSPFNIRVSLVEPGFIKTPILRSGKYTRNEILDYAYWRGNIHYQGETRLANGTDPQNVAQKVLKLIGDPQPPLYNPVFHDPLSALSGRSPEFLRAKAARWLMGVDNPLVEISRYGLLLTGISALLFGLWKLRKKDSAIIIPYK